LFVHGREAYRRNSYLILYMFYKNVIYVMPIFFYGWLSIFSGTPIYDSFLYNSYNIFFTGLPIMWYACYDQEYDKKSYLSNPALYEIGLKDTCFNPIIFWTLYFYAIWHGYLLMFLSFYTLDENSGERFVKYDEKIKKIPQTISGELHINGAFIFQAIVVLVNIKLLIETNSYSYLGVFMIIISIGSFYYFYYLIS
jgi:magnesium-transporting ATPase (P-type)